MVGLPGAVSARPGPKAGALQPMPPWVGRSRDAPSAGWQSIRSACVTDPSDSVQRAVRRQTPAALTGRTPDCRVRGTVWTVRSRCDLSARWRSDHGSRSVDHVAPLGTVHVSRVCDSRHILAAGFPWVSDLRPYWSMRLLVFCTTVEVALSNCCPSMCGEAAKGALRCAFGARRCGSRGIHLCRRPMNGAGIQARWRIVRG